MSDYLPLEIVQQILVRLHIKPLLRCSTTCKTWYNLITSSQFISFHLNFIKSVPNSRLLLIEYYTTENEKKCVPYSDDNNNGVILEEYSTRFRLPLEKSTTSLRIVGSCNGLICLTNTFFHSYANGANDQEVIIWNPMIRKSLILPQSDMLYRFDDDIMYLIYEPPTSPGTFGFVYDHIKDDYKVLRIYIWEQSPPIVEIFRLSTCLWEDIDHGAYFDKISGNSSQVNLRRVAHWIGEKINGRLNIITFDACEEVFGVMGLPINLVKEDEIYEPCEIYLHVFEELLFLIRGVRAGGFFDEEDDDFYNGPFERKFDVWKMEEYNVVESWKKVHSCVFDRSVQPLGFKNNGEILWATRGGRRLISTNLEDDSANDNGRCENCSLVCSCSNYVESLILLDKSIPSGTVG